MHVVGQPTTLFFDKVGERSEAKREGVEAVRSALCALDGRGCGMALSPRDRRALILGGIGVGIIASVAVESAVDSDLVVLDAKHLFDGHLTWIGFRRGALLRAYMYEFIELLAPHLPKRLVRETEKLEAQVEVDAALEDIQIPVKDMR